MLHSRSNLTEHRETLICTMHGLVACGVLWNEVMGGIATGPVSDKKTSIIKLMWCRAGGSYCIC